MLPAQHTGFNTLDNWGHKTPTQSKKRKRDKGQERKVKGSWPETYIQYTRLHLEKRIFILMTGHIETTYHNSKQ